MRRRLPSAREEGESRGPSKASTPHRGTTAVILGVEELNRRVGGLLRERDLEALRLGVSNLENSVAKSSPDRVPLPVEGAAAEGAGIRSDVLLAELRQIRKARTMSRARYYLRRLETSLGAPRLGGINDINMLRWQEYDDVWTDSLWVMGKRDSSGAHRGWYWGNFVPQIPRQMMLRYTKAGDWVLDGFAGSGTTLIECRRLGRNGIGIELNHRVAQAARRLVSKEENPAAVRTEMFEADSSKADMKSILGRLGVKAVQMLILHPPYHDIIRFSDDPDDLCNAADVDSFVGRFSACVDNLAPVLEAGRYMALVVGDKYSEGEWVPLGFLCMKEVLDRGGFVLKGIIVKNFDETRGKRRQTSLWRYRALAGGFYVFKHEYIFLFMKERAR